MTPAPNGQTMEGSVDNWRGKRVAITGVCGTVGRELLAQVCRMELSEVIGLDNNESELFFVGEEFRGLSGARFSLGDVRDRDTLVRKLEGVDVVLHAAAFKHVTLCEESPRDAVKTNILGTQNVIDAALQNGVSRVVFTSSDKAVNPTSVMGTSKLMGERLMTAAHAVRRDDFPIFASTRFGNVLGSRGSVIPIFKKQIADGGPVTVTHPDMTRFIMTLKQAVALVLKSVFLAHGGEVFVTKMPVVRIPDLARAMIEELAPRYGFAPESIEVEIIGVKPGEKMYEELMNDEETRRTLELEDYFVVTPAFKSIYHPSSESYPGLIRDSLDEPFNSANMTPMSSGELKAFLRLNRLLDDPSTAEIDDGRNVAAVTQS